MGMSELQLNQSFCQCLLSLIHVIITTLQLTSSTCFSVMYEELKDGEGEAQEKTKALWKKLC